MAEALVRELDGKNGDDDSTYAIRSIPTTLTYH